jgi:hypothetical protein
MSKQDDDSPCNPSANPHFSEILEVNLQRRRVVQSGLGMAALGFIGLPGASLIGSAEAASRRPVISFSSVSATGLDDVVVPQGYIAEVLYAWGDPISDGPAQKPDASDSAADQALQSGAHHDGMHYFPLGNGRAASERGLLAINHEYVDQGLLFPDGMVTWTAEKVAKAKAAHGASIIEVERGRDGKSAVVRPSRYARRITGDTPCRLSGPVAGSDFVKTVADPAGLYVLGTLNNCAHGYTPWGTYLTCEENWNGYFSNETSDVIGVPGADQKIEILSGQSRYGVTRGGFGYRWHEHDLRFRADLNPNEPNRFGWVVEIDPYDPESQPVKRTALGRIKHEGAWVCLARDRRVVVYMGDDERNEYIYKFVSSERFVPAGPAVPPGGRACRPETRSPLDEGTLYVAKFNADGTGVWIPLVFGLNGLTPENGFRDQAEVLVKTRQAADRVGATMMDRPEWIAKHPRTNEVYVTCTNNNRRGSSPASSNRIDGTTSAGSARPPLDAPNPRPINIFGHIVKWAENGGDNAALGFRWDIFVLCGDPSNPDPNKKGNIRGDIFGSPDGLWFDDSGRLWIQTDITGAAIGIGDYANIGNNQMLCADVASGEIRRFLTGPRICEVTGVVTTPDQRTMFVNIQHPGENPLAEFNDPANPKRFSDWPDRGNGTRPRSATIAIRRLDGGEIGT